VSCGKTAKSIDMLFWMKTLVGPRNRIFDGGADWEGAIFGGRPGHSKALAIFGAAITAAKHYCICYKRDHSIRE